MKIAIVGTGLVGSTAAYALLQRGVATEVALIDADARRAEGEMMDLAHAVPFFKNARVRADGWEGLAGSDAVLLAAGRSSRPGETRLDLLRDNAARVREICARLRAQGSAPVLLVVSNPVDVLTELAGRELDWPRGRVLGSGTTLDTARLKALLGERFSLDPHSIHGYVLGEHGDSEFVAWSTVRAGGVPLERWSGYRAEETESMFQAVRTAAYEIISRKKATYYAIGAASALILEAVLRDQRTVLPVSVPLRGEYGLSGLSLSLPCVLGTGGIVSVLQPELDEPERAALEASASALRKAWDGLAGL